MRGSLRQWFAPAVFALLALVLHIACGDRYGHFRDELYFVVCGQRPAWGYVDQPPLIAVVARFAWWLSRDGAAIWLFRLPAALSHCATVLVASAIAGRLGGGLFARALAAACVALAPIQLAQGHLLTMNTFELLLWAAITLTALAAVQGEPRAWIAAGVVLGLALLTKYSAAFFALALFVGLVATPSRSALRSPWLWSGVAIAFALALPSAWWQWRNDLPFLELLRNGQLYKNAALPLGTVIREAVFQQGPAAALIALGGLAWLLAGKAAGARFLGIAIAAVLAGMLALNPKPYYLAPAFTPLFAAGAVMIERWTARMSVRAVAMALVVLTAAPAVPIALPILPIESMLAWQARLGLKPERLERMEYTDVPQQYADQFGWRERVDAVVALVGSLSPEERTSLVIFAPNYGEAAALELFGVPRGLPPVISSHNQYALWGVPGEPQRVVALQGTEEDYREDFAQVRRLGQTPEIRYGMPYESGIPVFLLSGPRRPVSELLRDARHFE